MFKKGGSQINTTNKSFLLSISAISALIIGTGILFFNNRKMLDDIRAERVNSESIIHDRNFALQEIKVLKKENAHLKDENQKLEEESKFEHHSLELANSKLNSFQTKVNEIKLLEKQIAQFQTIKFNSEADNIRLNDQFQASQKLNQIQDQIIRSKEKEIEVLSARIKEHANKAILFDVEARKSLKGNLTTKARSTRSIHIEFSISQGTIPLNAPLYVTLTDLQLGKGISGNELPISIQVDGENITLNPVAFARWEGKGIADRMELDVELMQKLSKGQYQVDVYSDTRYLGGSRLRLQ